MKTKRTPKTSGSDTRYVVKKPATLKDYIRIYRMKNGVQKEAQELEKTLCPGH
jgi:hypothetical protein